MNKTADRTVALDKGRVDVYTKNGVTLYAYQTRDLIDNEVFVLAKKGRGVVIELPCFFDNIRELTDFLKSEGVTVEAKFVAYHAAGASFLRRSPPAAPNPPSPITRRAAAQGWSRISRTHSTTASIPPFARWITCWRRVRSSLRVSALL